MVRILGYLEKAWIAAGVCALVVMIYNLITIQTFDNRVYFPLFCAVFCLLIWFNIRGQKRFRQKMEEEKQVSSKNRP